ncbi:phospholipase D-like domain-containing protein [Suttonella ornithocola]|uniref:Cardiolipin synthase n=1 Tax=Suttonella ornithocola TaxID=279832 RepID=A0A380MZ59_9GAMM|nr:phospholipase D-like domain-containing protein [Suttonella ornithocola]SUO97306.1 Cardiolipin synthase [Suttonella ornithocola]
MYEMIVCALHAAQKSIMITTSYFVPDETLLLALTTAAKRGVDIVLILPKKSDAWLVSKASQAYYQMLLDVSVKIVVFDKRLLHTKAIVIDEVFAFFGTVNMDMRSFYLNMEVTLAVYDVETVQTILVLLKSYYQESHPVILKHWQKQPYFSRFIERCVRLISPLL